MKGILGRKEGMTQVFNKNGKLVPVTVVSVEPNVISQIKTNEIDGYESIQLAFEDKRETLSNKAQMGHLKKASTSAKRFLKEIRGVNVQEYSLGQQLTAEIFTVGEMVDVTGISKGKGFQGVIKRHNQSRGPMSHGSHYHRGPGSMGTMRPMRVFKGKKLPGHMGHETVTMMNLEIVAVDKENNCLLIKGNVPGPKKGLVVIKSAIKNMDTINEGYDLVTYVTEQPIVEEVQAEETISENINEETPLEEATTEEMPVTE